MLSDSPECMAELVRGFVPTMFSGVVLPDPMPLFRLAIISLLSVCLLFDVDACCKDLTFLSSMER